MRRFGSSCGGGRPPVLVTRERLVADLREFGLQAGDTVMLHASVAHIGWIVGGADQVLHAILDVLGEAGTLMMYIGWDGSPYDVTFGASEVPEVLQQAWPAFEPETAKAVPGWGILGEYLRTWPGAVRSNHPDSSFVAVGRFADTLVNDHPLQYGMGERSPLDLLCRNDGKVLLLGAPLSSTTLLHHAEHVADVPGKAVIHYWAPLLQAGRKEWVRIEEFSTEECLPWHGAGDMFDAIIEDYLQSGQGIVGPIAAARSYLFDASDLDRFAVLWIEERFLEPVERSFEVEVSQATPDDSVVVASLLTALSEERPGASPSNRRLGTRTDEYLEDRDRRVFLASANGQWVGILVAYKPSRERGILEEAYVDPGFRRRGILRQLEYCATDWLSGEGCCAIQVHVDAGDDTAREAWRSLGYAPSQEFLERPL